MYSYYEKREISFIRIDDTIIDMRKVNYIQKRGEELHVQFENEDSCLLRGVTMDQLSKVLFSEKAKSE